MVRWVVFQADAQEIPQRQRIGRTPRDAALRVNVFEVPDQQQPEVDAGRQARATHPLRVEAGALAFEEIKLCRSFRSADPLLQVPTTGAGKEVTRSNILTASGCRRVVPVRPNGTRDVASFSPPRNRSAVERIRTGAFY
jgi:hypothetical protein